MQPFAISFHVNEIVTRVFYCNFLTRSTESFIFDYRCAIEGGGVPILKTAPVKEFLLKYINIKAIVRYSRFYSHNNCLFKHTSREKKFVIFFYKVHEILFF